MGMGILAGVCFAAGSFAEGDGVTEAKRLMRNDRLTVEVMDPVHPERYHRGTRFSNVANVLQVTLDGKRFLASPVEHDPVLENGGLASEFDISAEDPPPGFIEAGVGESFLKIGVGVLEKTSNRYDFMSVYPVIRLADTEVAWQEDRAVFEQRCDAPTGFGYRFRAEVRLVEASIEIEFELENTGTRSISTEQYAHNYFRFDDRPIGAGYEVEFSGTFDLKLLPRSQDFGITFSNRTIRYERELEGPVNIMGERIGGPSHAHWVLVRNRPTGMSIRETTSQPSHRVMVHASAEYVCPEQFILIRLGPGESATWVRRYDFSTRAQ